jgi:hypothetical protein
MYVVAVLKGGGYAIMRSSIGYLEISAAVFLMFYREYSDIYRPSADFEDNFF